MHLLPSVYISAIHLFLFEQKTKNHPVEISIALVEIIENFFTNLSILKIETQLMAHPSIKLAVILSESKANSHNLIAYIVQSVKSVHLEIAEIKEFLTANLPSYMIPSQYFLIENVPLSRLH